MVKIVGFMDLLKLRDLYVRDGELIFALLTAFSSTLTFDFAPPHQHLPVYRIVFNLWYKVKTRNHSFYILKVV